jgi:hypothetical protein
LFHAQLGEFLIVIVVVVSEGWRVAEDLELQSIEKCVLESRRARVVCFVEFLQLIEKLADHGRKTTCALAQMALGFLDVMRLAGQADRRQSRLKEELSADLLTRGSPSEGMKVHP